MNNLHEQLYQFFRDLDQKIPPRDYHWDYRKAEPVPFLVLDNFLPQALFDAVSQQPDQIPEHLWTEFTRNGSLMKECKSLIQVPLLYTLSHCFNSGIFVDWLEAITSKNKLVPDPHMIGAGLSRTYRGHSLKLHTDFNWNDELALNRSLSMILYINPEWQPEWGGGLELWSLDRSQCLHTVEPRANRLIIWDYHENFVHGYPTRLTCPLDKPRTTLRMFYYQSHAQPQTTPHRSLYWWDNDGQLYDDRSQR
jgi:hypothetical protein